MAAVCLLGPHQILHGRIVAEQVKALGGEGEAGERRGRRLSPLARPKGAPPHPLRRIGDLRPVLTAETTLALDVGLHNI